MAGINTRVVGLGNHHTARTGTGIVSDVEPDVEPGEVPHVKVDWDSGDTSWVSADGVTPER
ncbi:hypothetical protein AB0D14_01925 [Streptomyces sp. NPDC048484]|uniref:hypothetical protein n=1 Tax=Streptomyces sp. NPDC048484 TaxID=3155146 RepID=UPI003447076A